MTLDISGLFAFDYAHELIERWMDVAEPTATRECFVEGPPSRRRLVYKWVVHHPADQS